jgi:hypothetical protein
MRLASLLVFRYQINVLIEKFKSLVHLEMFQRHFRVNINLAIDAYYFLFQKLDQVIYSGQTIYAKKVIFSPRIKTHSPVYQRVLVEGKIFEINRIIWELFKPWYGFGRYFQKEMLTFWVYLRKKNQTSQNFYFCRGLISPNQSLIL